ncbi:MAG: aminoacyl-histidine dipeptidase [Flavobacteriia bacterium]|nr:aminoacyl-histidine dipeptidase [Flavobacteriia bacterium]
MKIQDLKPNNLWNYFYEINLIPRASKKEEKIRDYLVSFAKNNQIKYQTDSVGNVFLYKNATSGYENHPIITLQAHMDMVHQKNNDTVFDFDNQAIEMHIDDDWVKANGTTLGADNGIGLAAILAVFASKDLKHPPLEALITMDEETGMTGAKNLNINYLKGNTLLNLDSEDEEEFSIGCAGGMDTNTSKNYTLLPISTVNISYEFSLSGLLGGHSGMDIHLGRGNANKLLNRVLYELLSVELTQLVSFVGGSLRNAIPREARMTLTFPFEKEEQLLALWLNVTEKISLEYKTIEPQILFQAKKVENEKNAINNEDSKDFCSCIHSVFNGVYRMSPEMKDLVETSSNLALVKLKNGQFETQSLQRSSIQSGIEEISRSVKCVFESFSCKVQQGNDYPGWKPNPNSMIVQKMSSWYKEMFNKNPKILACHAGLECGILSAHFPEMEMISFGPNIKGAHSPDEKVQISSVQNFWNFLVKTLENL